MEDRDEYKYKYKSGLGGRFDYPIDSSLNQLSATLGVSRKLVCTSLEALEQSDDDGFSLYDEIVKGRRRQPQTGEDPQTTCSAAVYWEARDLIAALALERAAHKKAQGNELARHTLRKLADTITRKQDEELKFADYHFLRHESIRANMYRSFHPEIEKRLRKIYELATTPSTDLQAENLALSIPTLDNLIIQMSYEVEPGQAEDAGVATVKKLYKDLTAMRVDRLYVEEEGFFYSNFGKLEKSDTTEHLAKTMKQRPKNLTHEDCEQFAAEYNDLLCRADPEITRSKDASLKFMSAYRQLAQYLLEQSDADKDFLEKLKADIKEELKAYIKSMFDAIQRFDDVPYFHTTFNNEASVQTAFLGSRLAFAHDHIHAAIHAPLVLIRLLYVRQYFGVERSSKDHTLARNIFVTLEQLADSVNKSEHCPPLPLYKQNSEFNSLEFTNEFNGSVVPFLGVEEVSLEKINAMLSSEDMRAWGELLRLECLVVACEVANQIIDECTNQVLLIQKQLGRVTQNVKQS